MNARVYTSICMSYKSTCVCLTLNTYISHTHPHMRTHTDRHIHHSSHTTQIGTHHSYTNTFTHTHNNILAHLHTMYTHTNDLIYCGLDVSSKCWNLTLGVIVLGVGCLRRLGSILLNGWVKAVTET